MLATGGVTEVHTTRRRSQRTHRRIGTPELAFWKSLETASHADNTRLHPALLQLPPSSPSTSEEVWGAHGTPPRAPTRARRRFSWFDQRPSSACSPLSGPSPRSPDSPLHTPPSAANAHTQRARARRQARGQNGRPDDVHSRGLARVSCPGVSVVLGVGACMQSSFGSFCASRLPCQRARLCMNALVRSALRVASARCLCRVLRVPFACTTGGGCAQTATRVCSLLLRYQDYTLHYLSHPY